MKFTIIRAFIWSLYALLNNDEIVPQNSLNQQRGTRKVGSIWG